MYSALHPLLAHLHAVFWWSDHVLRRAAPQHKRRAPFGGRTIIAIGDLCQLPPVPPRLFGVYNNCAVYVLGLWSKFKMHELRENFCQQDDPEFQICLDELHNGVLDGEAWGVLLTRVVGLDGNQELEHTTHDSLINASQATPCIAPYKRSSPDQGDTLPQSHEINEDHLRALGDNGEECRFLHTQAFVKQNGTKLNRDKGRHPIVLEYADLPDTLVLHEGLKVRFMEYSTCLVGGKGVHYHAASYSLHENLASCLKRITNTEHSHPRHDFFHNTQIVITKNVD